jgi:hypothetical protein
MTLPSEPQAEDKANQGNDENVKPEKGQWHVHNAEQLDRDHDESQSINEPLLRGFGCVHPKHARKSDPEENPQ